VENLGSIALPSSFSQLVPFPSTLQDNGKVLHDLQKEFKGLNKLVTLSGILISFERVMKPNIFYHIYAEESVERKDLAIQEMKANSVSPHHSQHANNIESINQINEEVENEFNSRIGLGKPQYFNINESLTFKCKGKEATGIAKCSE
jgi:hypothetical protein